VPGWAVFALRRKWPGTQGKVAPDVLRSEGPVTLQFPPFRGLVRRIVLAAAVIWVVFAIATVVLPEFRPNLEDLIALRPELVRKGLVWLPFTYSFAPTDLVGEVFALLSFWIFAGQLQEEFGRKWLREFFFVSAAGGGFLTCLISYAVASRWPLLAPWNRTFGMGPAALAIVMAYASYHSEATLRFNFIFKMKAKHLALVYVALYMFSLLIGVDKLGALNALCVALAAYLYLRFGPRKGFGFSLSEQWYSVRNAFYRNKRRRAAKKFTVYMKKQGKDVSIDEAGRYVDPNGTPRDPNDRNWMN